MKSMFKYCTLVLLAILSANSHVFGQQTQNYVTKFNSSLSLINSLIYDNGTYVGIGTPSPAYPFDVNGNERIQGASNPYLRIDQTGAPATWYLQAYQGEIGLGSTWANSLIINSSGRVGIGTPAPATSLDVFDGGGVGFPATSGTSQPNASLRLANLGTTAILDIGAYSTYGAWLQATNRGNLSTNYPLLLNPNGGNVGIGTTNPTYTLTVAVNNNGVGISGNNSSFVGADLSINRSSSATGVGNGSAIQFNDNGSASYNIIQGSSGGLQFFNNYSGSGWIERMRMIPSGNVLIGQTSQVGNYRLDVKGGVRADSVVVNTTGADFVFDENYQKMSLDSLSQYLEKHKHLPGISSSEEMKKDGVSVGALQTKLLQKVEELTLYVIEQNKEIKSQNEQIQEQGRKIGQLEKENLKLRNKE